ncbi:hypothetical protein Peetri_00163 [Pseudomonas phage vB_PpuM-Peetri]
MIYSYISDMPHADMVRNPDYVFSCYRNPQVIKALAGLIPDVKYPSRGYPSQALLDSMATYIRHFPEAKAVTDDLPLVQTSVPLIRSHVIKPSLDASENLLANGKCWLDTKVIGSPTVVTPELGYYILDAYEELVIRMAARGYTPRSNCCYGLAMIISRLVVLFPVLLDRYFKGREAVYDSPTDNAINSMYEMMTGGYYSNAMCREKESKGIPITENDKVKLTLPLTLEGARAFYEWNRWREDKQVDDQSREGKIDVACYLENNGGYLSGEYFDTMDWSTMGEGWGLGTREGERRFEGLFYWDQSDKKTYAWPDVLKCLDQMGIMKLVTEHDIFRGKTKTFRMGESICSFVSEARTRVDRLWRKHTQRVMSGQKMTITQLPSNLVGENTLIPNGIYAFSLSGDVCMVFSSELPDGTVQSRGTRLKHIKTYHSVDHPVPAKVLMRRAALCNRLPYTKPAYAEIAEGIDLSGRLSVPPSLKQYATLLTQKQVEVDLNSLFDAFLAYQRQASTQAVSSVMFLLNKITNPENLRCTQSSLDRSDQLRVSHQSDCVIRVRSPRLYQPNGFSALPSSIKQAIMKDSGYYNYDIASCHPLIVHSLVTRYKDRLNHYVEESVIAKADKVFNSYLNKRWVENLLNLVEIKHPGLLTSMEYMFFTAGEFSTNSGMGSLYDWLSSEYGDGFRIVDGRAVFEDEDDCDPRHSNFGFYQSVNSEDYRGFEDVWEPTTFDKDFHAERFGAEWERCPETEEWRVANKEPVRQSKWLAAVRLNKQGYDGVSTLQSACKKVFISTLYGSNLSTSLGSLRMSRVFKQLVNDLYEGWFESNKKFPYMHPNAKTAMLCKVVEFSYLLMGCAKELADPVVQCVDSLTRMFLRHPDTKESDHPAMPINIDLIARRSSSMRKKLDKTKEEGKDKAHAVMLVNAIGQRAYFYQDKHLGAWINRSERGKAMHFILCGMEQAVMIEFNTKHQDILIAQEHDGMMTDAPLSVEDLKEFTEIAERKIGVPLVLVRKDFA